MGLQGGFGGGVEGDGDGTAGPVGGVAAALRTAESWEGPLTGTLCREVRTAAENIRAIIAEAQKKVSLS